AASMIGWPLYRLGKGIHKRGRLPDMKPVRATISGSLLASVLLLFFLLPLPVSRVRQTGLVQVQPEDIVPVHVHEPGKLVKIFVKEGDWVAKGKDLAEFNNPEMMFQLEELQNKYLNQKRRVQAFKPYEKESPELEKARKAAEADRDVA